MAIAYLLLMPIAYYLHSIDDPAQAIYIYILVVPQHFGGGMTNQGQLVFIGTGDILHQGSECVPAAVWGVFFAVYTLYFRGWVIDSAGVQNLIEYLAVLCNGHSGAVLFAEYITCNFICNQPVDDRLDFFVYALQWTFGSRPFRRIHNLQFYLQPAGR